MINNFNWKYRENLDFAELLQDYASAETGGFGFI
jgi:hypothetical protein